MILYSIQTPEVLRLINKGIKYRPDEMQSKHIKAVKNLYKHYMKKVDYKHYPVWGMYKYCGKLIEELGYHQYLSEYCDYDKGMVLLKLNVDNDLITLSDYHKWCSVFNLFFIFEEACYKEIDDCLLKSKNKINKTYNIQATFPYITKNMILDVFYINRKPFNRYAEEIFDEQGNQIFEDELIGSGW